MGKSLINESTTDLLKGTLENSQESAREVTKRPKAKPVSFKKPSSDYLMLDLIVRKAEKVEYPYERINKNGKREKVTRKINMQKEEVIKDYKEYLLDRSNEERISITKYIHKLIDADMKKHKKNK